MGWQDYIPTGAYTPAPGSAKQETPVDDPNVKNGHYQYYQGTYWGGPDDLDHNDPYNILSPPGGAAAPGYGGGMPGVGIRGTMGDYLSASQNTLAGMEGGKYSQAGLMGTLGQSSAARGLASSAAQGGALGRFAAVGAAPGVLGGIGLDAASQRAQEMSDAYGASQAAFGEGINSEQVIQDDLFNRQQAEWLVEDAKRRRELAGDDADLQFAADQASDERLKVPATDPKPGRQRHLEEPNRGGGYDAESVQYHGGAQMAPASTAIEGTDFGALNASLGRVAPWERELWPGFEGQDQIAPEPAPRFVPPTVAAVGPELAGTASGTRPAPEFQAGDDFNGPYPAVDHGIDHAYVLPWMRGKPPAYQGPGPILDPQLEMARAGRVEQGKAQLEQMGVPLAPSHEIDSTGAPTAPVDVISGYAPPGPPPPEDWRAPDVVTGGPDRSYADELYDPNPYTPDIITGGAPSPPPAPDPPPAPLPKLPDYIREQGLTKRWTPPATKRFRQSMTAFGPLEADFGSDMKAKSGHFAKTRQVMDQTANKAIDWKNSVGDAMGRAAGKVPPPILQRLTPDEAKRMQEDAGGDYPGPDPKGAPVPPPWQPRDMGVDPRLSTDPPRTPRAPGEPGKPNIWLKPDGPVIYMDPPPLTPRDVRRVRR